MITHILLIEDDVEQRGEILEYMLRRRHRVTACASISEAGEALDGAVPDAVVSDVQLPDGDGVTFLRQQCQAPDGSRCLATTIAYGSPTNSRPSPTYRPARSSTSLYCSAC